MKKLQLLSVCFSISVLSTAAFAQIIPPDYTTIIKTNVLIVKDVQQWALSVETKTKKPKQTNNYTIGYNWLSNGRTGRYAGYSRRFYTPPTLNRLSFFVSPYGKIIYRDVHGEGFWLIGGPNFQSVSIAAGGNIGLQSIQFKRMSIEFVMGIGVGAVLWQDRYKGDALPIHLDEQLMIQLGYTF